VPTQRPAIASTPPPTATSLVPTGNLLPDSSFESASTGSWGSWHGSFSRQQVTGAPDGDWVARIDFTPPSPMPPPSQYNPAYSLDYYPQLQPVAGQKYQLTAYVAAATPSAVNKPIQLTFREWSASNHDVLETPVLGTLTSSYQKLTVTVTVQASGDHPEIFLLETGADASDVMLIDAVSLVPIP
jgi:hypothetical protein